MREHPVIFSAPMVRAILAGNKTQTRRVLKIRGVDGGQHAITSPDEEVLRFDDGTFHYLSTGALSGPYACPYGQPGDRLWVRETLACTAHHGVWYAADADGFNNLIKDRRASDLCERYGHPYFDIEERHIPSIHMPRWASRITLEITDVRVQRVQDISETDAVAEGLTGVTKDGRRMKYGIPDRDGLPGNDDDGWDWADWRMSPVDAFHHLWDAINAKRGFGWAVNPWVWALTFKRVDVDD